MSNDQLKHVENSVRAILDDARDVSPDAKKNNNKNTTHKADVTFKKRRHFALGVFLTGILLGMITLLLPKEDHLFWGSFCWVLMLVAGWQWDKAKRELDKTLTEIDPDFENVVQFKRDPD